MIFIQPMIKAFRSQFRGVQSVDFFLFRLSNIYAWFYLSPRNTDWSSIPHHYLTSALIKPAPSPDVEKTSFASKRKILDSDGFIKPFGSQLLSFVLLWVDIQLFKNYNIFMVLFDNIWNFEIPKDAFRQQ